jgi:hypothetical protein
LERSEWKKKDDRIERVVVFYAKIWGVALDSARLIGAMYPWSYLQATYKPRAKPRKASKRLKSTREATRPFA